MYAFGKLLHLVQNTMNNNETGWLSEIFSSVQGEGLYVGQKQTFLRFVGCNIKCAFCDTPGAGLSYDIRSNTTSCEIKNEFGGKVADNLINPISVEKLLEICLLFNNKSISLTGGEPLLYVEFLNPLIDVLKEYGFSIHLETNGTLPEELSLIVDKCDVIAMDIKLPSHVSGINDSLQIETHWQNQQRFLEIANKTDVFVKVVVCEPSKDNEFQKAVEIIEKVDSSIPLVIQPVSGSNNALPHLINFYDLAQSKLANVRIIPQCHKVLGVL